MEYTWIRGDRNTARWHIATEHDTGYGTRHWVPICGRSVYSPYGPARVVCERPSEVEYAICKACAARLK